VRVPDGESQLQLPIAWIGTDEAPIVACNQFLGQFSAENELIVTFGHLAPPALLGSPEERLEQAKEISYVPIRVVARLGMNRLRVEELIRVLQEILANHDETFKRSGSDPA
jgi:hypothetical protein